MRSDGPVSPVALANRNIMNDETTIVMVVTGTLAVFVFMAVQVKARKSNRQHSLGAMYRPAPKKQQPPTTPDL